MAPQPRMTVIPLFQVLTMTTATVVLFIFLSHHPTGASPDNVVTACVHALADGGRPVVRETAEAPPDEAVAAEAASVGAASAVVVAWEDANLLAAQIRVLTGGGARARWSWRRISFERADQVAERDRALGLVIASMIEDGFDVRVAARPPAEPAAGARGAVAAAPTADAERSAVAPAAPTPPRWTLEADAVTAFEAGADLVDAIGGGIGLRRLLPHNLAARAGLTFRLTEPDDTAFRTRAVLGALGVVWVVRDYRRRGAVGFGIRADLLLMRESVHHSMASAHGADHQAFWSPGADLFAEGQIGLSAETALFMALGGETMFTEAEVVVGQTLVASLPRNQLLLRVGILARF